MEENKGICVKITADNKKIIQDWWKDMKYPGSKAWSIGAYYGTNADGSSHSSENTFNNVVLSTEEFIDQIVNKNKSENYSVF